MDPITRLTAIGAAGVAGISEHWAYYYYDNSDTNNQTIQLDVDSSGNIYTLDTFQSAPATPVVTKLDAYGIVQWQKDLSAPTATNMYGWGLVYQQSSGNVVVTGGTDSTLGAGASDIFICVLNGSNGSVVSSNYYGTSNTDYATVQTVQDNSGNIYVPSRGGTSAVNGGISKFNSSLTWQWTGLSVPGTTGSHVPYCCATDGTNVFVGGYTPGAANIRNEPYLEKRNSSGARTAYIQHNMSAAIAFPPFEKLVCDSNGNVLTLFSGTSSQGYILALFNNSLVVQWEKQVDTSSPNRKALAVDSSDNFYILVDENLIKINNSGTIQWQRQINLSPGGESWLMHDGNGSILVRMRITFYQYTFKLPDDGSGTGTYDFFDYSVSSTYTLPTVTAYSASSFTTTTTTSSLTTNTGDVTSANTTRNQQEAIDYI